MIMNLSVLLKRFLFFVFFMQMKMLGGGKMSALLNLKHITQETMIPDNGL